MSGNSFNPQNLIIDVGDTVEWINSSNVVHTSTSGTECNGDGLWDSGSLSPGESFIFEFTGDGIFDYFCIPHCENGMVGTITVEY